MLAGKSGSERCISTSTTSRQALISLSLSSQWPRHRSRSARCRLCAPANSRVGICEDSTSVAWQAITCAQSRRQAVKRGQRRGNSSKRPATISNCRLGRRAQAVSERQDLRVLQRPGLEVGIDEDQFARPARRSLRQRQPHGSPELTAPVDERRTWRSIGCHSRLRVVRSVGRPQPAVGQPFVDQRPRRGAGRTHGPGIELALGRPAHAAAARRARWRAATRR